MILSSVICHFSEKKRPLLGKMAPLADSAEDSAVIDMLDVPAVGKVDTNGKPMAKISSSPEKLMKLPSTLTLQTDLKRRLSTSMVGNGTGVGSQRRD